MKIMLAMPIGESKLEEQTYDGYGLDKIEKNILSIKGLDPKDVYIFSDRPIRTRFNNQIINQEYLKKLNTPFMVKCDNPILMNITLAREAAREFFLKSDYDAILFLDSDIEVQPDILIKLKAAVEDDAGTLIASNLYPPDYSTKQLGCSLILREALEYINFVAYSKDTNTVGEDWHFIRMAELLGIPIRLERFSDVKHHSWAYK